MSVLDKIGGWIENLLIKIGLVEKKEETKYIKLLDSKYEKYPNVDQEIQKEINYTIFNYELSRDVDIIINNLIDNKDHVTKVSFSLCCVTFELDNGTSIEIWIENCWYAFMRDVNLTNKDGVKTVFSSKRPSVDTMLRFLDTFYYCFHIEGKKILPPTESSKKYYTDTYFTFDNPEEKEQTNESER